VREGGVAHALRVGGQDHRAQRPDVGRQAVTDARGVLVDDRHQAGVVVGGGEAGDADGDGELLQAGVGGTEGSTGGSAAEQAIHEKKRYGPPGSQRYS
jgi:hypothetical protein